MKRLATTLLLALAVTATQAGNLEDGLRHLNAKAYVAAAAAFQAAAANGNAVAERELGFLYYRGLGLPQSDAEAVVWFERAAANGDLQSQINLGQMYENGLSVAQSDSRSAHWYELAARQGDRRSQLRYGEILYVGTGVAPDRAEAVKWWRIAMSVDDDMTTQMRSMLESTLPKIPSDVLAEGERRANAWRAATDRR